MNASYENSLCETDPDSAGLKAAFKVRLAQTKHTQQWHNALFKSTLFLQLAQTKSNKDMQQLSLLGLKFLA